MWGSVWNRVALLAAGMLLGWNLVHYWAAPDARRREYLVRMALGAVLGLALVVVLALTNVGAALLGLAVILFCALVAFAGNARQLLKKPLELPSLPPDRPIAWSATPAIYLVGDWEPERYEGPAVWAGVAHRRAALGQPTPHWMAFPHMCGRIRRAYAAMGGASPTMAAVQRLALAVQDGLDAPAEVHLATALQLRELGTALRKSFSQGQHTFVLAPLGLPDHALAELRRMVTDTRIREAGAVIHYAPNVDLSAWLGDDRARLDQLWQGEPIAAPGSPDAALVAAVSNAVGRAAPPSL
jgi:hypothetical protein